MSSSELLVGSSLGEVSTKLADAIRSLPANTVAGLGETLLAEVDPHLPAQTRGGRELSGLKLELGDSQNPLARAGWLIARYLDSARALGIGGSGYVAACVDGVFRELEQAALLRPHPTLLLGIGPNGLASLQAILDAGLRFDPADFDADGGRK